MSLKMFASETIASSNSEDVSQAQAWLTFVVRSRHGLIKFLTGLGAQDVKTSSNSGARAYVPRRASFACLSTLPCAVRELGERALVPCKENVEAAVHAYPMGEIELATTSPPTMISSASY